MSSSKKPTSVQSLDEYYDLYNLYEKAFDRIQSGGTGAGWSGIHYELMHKARRYGLSPNGREDAMRAIKQLMEEYEREHLGSQAQSDEEYLSRFDEDDLK